MPAEATDPNYWARLPRREAHLHDVVRELAATPRTLLLEVGACGLSPASGTGEAPAATWEDEGFGRRALLCAFGRLWLAGVEFDWQALYAGERRGRIELPTYPFERRSYWV
jgi:acyl transferase domain-containing protein